MLTTRLQTVHASVATTRGSSSEQIWTGLHSVGHKMSGGRSQVWCGGGGVGPRSDVQRGGGILPCYLSRDVFDVTYPPPPYEQTPVKTLTFRNFVSIPHVYVFQYVMSHFQYFIKYFILAKLQSHIYSIWYVWAFQI